MQSLFPVASCKPEPVRLEKHCLNSNYQGNRQAYLAHHYTDNRSTVHTALCYTPMEVFLPTKTERVITWTDRSWVRRQYQQFCGRFELDETSGLFFDWNTPESNRQLISRNFSRLPQSLRAAALYLKLTVSTTNNAYTLSGNHSAVYGDWERQHAQISPHLEMSASSLHAAIAFPHLVHECCHLFWAIQSRAAKAAYIDKMVTLAEQLGTDEFVEVTGYAQSYFDEWRGLRDAEGTGADLMRKRTMHKWAMESFCESVAKICCPTYKEAEKRDARVLLAERLKIMREEFNFDPTNSTAVA
jgi:hypothetical protein